MEAHCRLEDTQYCDKNTASQRTCVRNYNDNAIRGRENTTTTNNTTATTTTTTTIVITTTTTTTTTTRTSAVYELQITWIDISLLPIH